VGPAGLAASKEIKGLAFPETVEGRYVSRCLSQRIVSTSGSIGVPQPEFERVEHSVYLGRERLGRYVQTGPKKYKAFDAYDRPLGNFRVRARALAAIDKARRARQ
jgi:hypothetical protein